MSDAHAHHAPLARLLLRREALFARIHEVETKIATILGQDYPFDPPPPLPSTTIKRKVARTKSTVHEPRGKQPSPPAAGTTHTYRVCYYQSGTLIEELHSDWSVVEPLLELETEDFILESIEALSLSPEATQTLYRRSTSGTPS